MEIPVYLFTGFIDSGKTSLITETLFSNGFTYGMKSFLVILCEEGDEIITNERLSQLGGSVVIIEDEEDFTPEKLCELDNEYEPEAVFLEYNGTWSVDKLFDMEGGPKDWVIAQTLCTIDSTTFESYMQNMRQMMVECIKKAEVVIFNRFTGDMSKAKFRANIKSINRPAQIAYERPDHSIDESEEELPFDISADEIEISDADYAFWFMDCMDHPEKYVGKTVSFLGLVYNPTKGKGVLKNGTFVPGRFAMTCCADDIQFLGMKCKYKASKSIEHKSWIKIKAQIKSEFVKEYHGDGPVLYPISIEPGEKPEDELVYFN